MNRNIIQNSEFVKLDRSFGEKRTAWLYRRGPLLSFGDIRLGENFASGLPKKNVAGIGSA